MRSKWEHMSQRFSEDDYVRVDIPDVTDPDHERYHGRHGIITAVTKDDTHTITVDERDSIMYRVKFEDGTKADFRWRDIRSPLVE